MPVLETLRVGDDRLVCHDWHAGTHTVVIGPIHSERRLHPSSIRQVLDLLERRGVKRVLTTVLDEGTVEPFADAGFSPDTAICLLHHDLVRFPSPDGPRPRRGRPRRDLSMAARIDARAFAAYDPMDEHGLRAALAATPTTRFRLLDQPGPVGSGDTTGAFALCGFAGNLGYVQRLAVDPDCRRCGLATALVVDGLSWFRRRGAYRAQVTTQSDNLVARRLYERLGFTESSRRLAVWSRVCDPNR